jgi:hypothetical protein
MADVKYTVTVDSTGAVKQIEALDAAWGKTKDGMKGVGEQASTTEGQTQSLWKQFALGQFAMDAAYKALRILKNEFISAINESAEYEKANKGLAAAFEISGRTMPGMVDNLRSYASELENLGLAEDDEILRSESLLLQLTNLNEQGVKEATRGAIGLASVFGMDLAAATETVARGMEGQYRALNMMFPSLRNATTEGEKHAELLRIMEGLYQRAIADTTTYSGQVKQLGLEWKAAKQSFGDAVLNTGLLQEVMGQLGRMIDDLSGNKTRRLAEETDKFIEAEGEASKILWEVGEATGKNSSWAYDLGQQYHLTAQQTLEWVRSNMLGTKEAAAAKVAVDAHNAAVDAAGKGFTETGKTIDKLAANLKTLGIAERSVVQDELKLAEQTLDMAIKGKAGQGVVEQLSAKVAELRTKLEGTALAMNEFGHLTRAENLKAGPAFRDIEDSAASMTRQFDKTKSVLSQLIGGPLGDLADAGGEVEDVASGIIVAWEKVSYAFEGLPVRKTRALLKEMTDELERMRRVGGYTNNQIHEMERRIKELERTLKDTPQFVLKLRDAMAEAAPYVNAAIQGMNAIFQQAQQNKEIAIENEYKKRLNLINATVKDEEQKQKAIIALEAEFEIKRTSAKAAAAKQAKAVALAEAVWNTASAVAEALPNLVLAGIVGVLGAVQIAMIAKQPIPLARGAVFTKPTIISTSEGQTFEVGEAGVEYLVPEKHLAPMMGGGRPTPSGLMGRGRQGANVTINIHAPLVSTRGLTQAELEQAGDELFRTIERRARSRGRW